VRVVVTGGAGFIGANLCRALRKRLADGSQIVALDDLSTGFADNLAGLDVELVQGSILDRKLLAKVTAGADSVVHLAARPSVPRSLQDPIASHETNVTGTAYVLEAARTAGSHVVVASSSSVYGSTVELPKHEDLPTRPLSPYGASKLAGEAYTLAWASSFGVPTLPFRFFNVYGPLQAAGHAYAAVIPVFIDAALNGQPLPVHGDGLQTRDFTFVETVCSVLTDAVVRRVTSDVPVNLAFGTRITIADLVAQLESAMGTPLTIENNPTRPGDIRDSQASSERLHELFPDIKSVPLTQGLEETIAWFRSTRD
jgi:UDP-glucose 4-epimerase